MTLAQIKTLDVPVHKQLDLALDECLRIAKMPILSKRALAGAEQGLLQAQMFQAAAHETRYAGRVNELVKLIETAIANAPYFD